MADLTRASEHFAFGRNWASFVDLVDDERIALAENGIRALFPNGELERARVLDIGSGSGLSALAMLRCGASFVDCVDIDADSVATTTALLTRHADGTRWSAREASVFDLDGEYDVVHSWGVLHQTGAMWRAIECAGARVKPGGYLAISIYAKTLLCGAWRIEKRIYSRSPKPVQQTIAAIYKVGYAARLAATRKNPFAHSRNHNTRGMDWTHDVHDWLGGYPHESAYPSEVAAFLKERGFSMIRLPADVKSIGLFGSGCCEMVARRT